ncbi:hypothetical protein [Streptomyces sp. ISL-43]|uniref:hypothetical protein n=1 Tax=Streptomyces sp. ISL-43 TaxID=2819183 RepID=UPI0027E3ECE3|nr:hypothetical protein [Streptomyces sp. ISL-43]
MNWEKRGAPHALGIAVSPADPATVPGGRPQALTTVDAEHLVVATQDRVHESTDGGKTFTKRLAVTADADH